MVCKVAAVRSNEGVAAAVCMAGTQSPLLLFTRVNCRKVCNASLPEPAGEPQLVMAFEAPFTPPAALVDDYHCLPVGDAFPEDTWVTASRIVPGSEATVHHVIAYLVGAEDVAAMEDADAEVLLAGVWP